MFEERYAELERKIKQEAESAATAQKPNEIESAAHNLGEDADAAAHNLGEEANAAAAHNLGEDANATAAKEKAKKSGDMPSSHNSKNEKIKEGDDEIRRLNEERKSILKGDRHQLREGSKRIKKCIRDRKRSKRQERYSGFLKNSSASKVQHAQTLEEKERSSRK